MGGTIVYSPPSDRAMTFGWDDWAVGVILYAMVTRTLPFSREDLLQQRDLVLNVPHHISDGSYKKQKTQDKKQKLQEIQKIEKTHKSTIFWGGVLFEAFI